jgi:hypothetical protein
MFSTVETITPQIAEEMLRKNDGNRSVREWWVKELAAIIKRGDWVLTHQGVAFAEDGTLVDGQHRLMAVVRANVPVMMAVTRNVQRDAFYVLDIGVKRSVSDILNADAKVLQACAYALTVSDGGRPAPRDVERVLLSPFGEEVIAVVKACSHRARIFGSAVFKVAAATQIIRGVTSREYAHASYRQLNVMDFENMTPMVMSVYKQVVGTSATRSPEIMARALAAFDESRKMTTRLVLQELSVSEAFPTVRGVVRKCIGEE